MNTLKINSPDNRDFSVNVSVHMDKRTLVNKISEDCDLVIDTVHGSMIVIPKELKKRLYYRLTENDEG